MPELAYPELLIVDDDPMLRMDLADRLRRRGFAVLRASNADQAIRLMESHPSVRAVLSDMVMPGSMNGLELLHVIARRWPGCRLILISGMSSPCADHMPPHTQFLLKPASRAFLDKALQICSLRGCRSPFRRSRLPTRHWPHKRDSPRSAVLIQPSERVGSSCDTS